MKNNFKHAKKLSTITLQFQDLVKKLSKDKNNMKDKDSRKKMLEDVLPMLESVGKELELGHAAVNMLDKELVNAKADAVFHQQVANHYKSKADTLTAMKKVKFGPFTIGLMKDDESA